MALKSPTERINELERLAALLNERLDATRKELEGETAARADVAKDLADLRKDFGEWKTQFALLQRDFAGLSQWKEELKKEKEETARRLWAFGPNFVAAIMSGIISLLVALLVLWLNKPSK